MLNPIEFDDFSEFDCDKLESLRLCRFQQLNEDLQKTTLYIDTDNSLHIVCQERSTVTSLGQDLAGGSLPLNAYIILGVQKVALWLKNYQIYATNLASALELSNKEKNSEAIPMVEVLEKNETGTTNGTVDVVADAIVKDYVPANLEVDITKALNKALDKYLPVGKIREQMAQKLPGLMEKRVYELAETVVTSQETSATPDSESSAEPQRGRPKKQAAEGEDFIKTAERRLKRSYNPGATTRYRTRLIDAALAIAKNNADQAVGYLQEMQGQTELGQSLLKLIAPQSKNKQQQNIAWEKFLAEIPGAIQSLESTKSTPTK